ncbi:MAG: electron transfer flavoprotein subunit alpha/FixB family protein [Acidobacteriota bacterium]
MILVVAEQRDGKLNPASWESIAAAQQLVEVGATGPITVAALGSDVAALAGELAAADVAGVVTVQASGLSPYTPGAYVQAVRQVIEHTSASLVVLPHTYQARDFASALATAIDRALVTDVIGVKAVNGEPAFSRPMFQGKLTADVVPVGEGPHIVTIQIGAFRADAARRGASAAAITPVEVTLDAAAIRQSPEPPFQEAKQAVDLAQAERIVAVGRGIKTQDNLPVAESLAKAFHAELAASRPICDNGWLPMERQIGSSGQTVAPKLYVALGISGAIQHLVGMKGSRTIVAINKDTEAPIFEVADYGIAGDIFEIAPALVAELTK